MYRSAVLGILAIVFFALPVAASASTVSTITWGSKTNAASGKMCPSGSVAVGLTYTGGNSSGPYWDVICQHISAPGLSFGSATYSESISGYAGENVPNYAACSTGDAVTGVNSIYFSYDNGGGNYGYGWTPRGVCQSLSAPGLTWGSTKTESMNGGWGSTSATSYCPSGNVLVDTLSSGASQRYFQCRSISDTTVLCADGTAAPGNEVSQCAPVNPCSTNPLMCVQTCPDGSQAQNGICPDTTNTNGTNNAGTQCQTGYVSLSGSCTLSCPAGQAYQGNQCVGSCDIGYVAQGGVCIFTSCPNNYTEEGGACVLTSCPANSVLVDGTCQYSGGSAEGAGGGTQAPTITSWKVLPLLVKSDSTSNVSWSAKNVSSCTVTGNGADLWTGATGNHPSNAITGQTIFRLACTGLDGTQISTSSTVNVVPTFQER